MTSTSAELTKASASAPAGIKTKHYRIASKELAVGMFVAELDRPWIDTPFLLQGFLIDSVTELETVRRFCRYVKVDLELSNPEVAEAIKTAELKAIQEAEPTVDRRGFAKAAPPGTPERRKKEGASFKVRSDLQVDRQTRQKFRDFIRDVGSGSTSRQDNSWLHRMLVKLGLAKPKPGAATKVKRGPKQLDPALAKELKEQLPKGVKLVVHKETVPVLQELPRARKSVAKSEKVLESVVADIRQGGAVQVEKVQEAVDDMVASMIDNPDALMWIARLRDEDMNTYAHGVKVSLYMIALGRQIGLPKQQLALLGMVGMLADVGKTKIPRALLDKPGMLSPSEHSVIKEHVRLGIEALKSTGQLGEEVEQGIAQHHERLDGSGYPRGLKGAEISLYGRIAGIADSFAALVTPRAYANAQAPQDALMSLYQWSGISFPEALIEQFVQAIGVFPVGTLVELSSGEIGVVIAQNRVRRLEPKVLVLTWPDKKPLPQPIERDLMTAKNSDASLRNLRIARGLPSGAYGLKMRDFYADAIVDANAQL